MDPQWQIINFKWQNCQPTTGLLLATSRAPVFPKLIECTVATHYKRAVDSSNKSKYFKPANYTAVSPNILKPLIVVLIEHKPIFQKVNSTNYQPMKTQLDTIIIQLHIHKLINKNFNQYTSLQQKWLNIPKLKAFTDSSITTQYSKCIFEILIWDDSWTKLKASISLM